MMDDLIALAGDLVFERKKLSEGLRRLEGLLLRGDVAKELFKTIGVQKAEGIHGELDALARSLDRIGALTKTLVHSVNHDRLVDCEPFLAEAVLTANGAAMRLDRSITVDCRMIDVRIDRTLIERFRPLFFEMLESFVQFCIEPPLERVARKKRPKAHLQIEVKPMEDGYRLMVVSDGNGILPPLVADHGIRLAEMGVRAMFEGKPGQWSAWVFHLPANLGAFRCLPVRAGTRRLCIPSWAVVEARPIEAGRPKPNQKIWALGDSIGRFEVDASFASSYGNFVVEVSAGTHGAIYVVDEIFESDEVFMKPLPETFSGNGRFLGVVVTETTELLSESAHHNELCLVMNPAYMVYGEAVLKRHKPGRRVPAGGKHAV